MTEYNQDFTIRGDLRMQEQHWKQCNGMKSAQVLCFADIEWSGTEFLNVLLLKLDIEGDQEDGWKVKDDFAASFPYMKPVRAFRKYLANQLVNFVGDLPTARSPWCPLWMGVNQYVNELQAFDETRSLLGQLSSIHQAYGRKRGHHSTRADELQAIKDMTRSLLLAVDVKPGTDRPFQVT